jgi:excisionase family DNA binding protein
VPPLTLANAPDSLTVRQAQQILAIGRDATYALINSGALASFRAGRSIRVPRVAVERLLGVR